MSLGRRRDNSFGSCDVWISYPYVPHHCLMAASQLQAQKRSVGLRGHYTLLACRQEVDLGLDCEIPFIGPGSMNPEPLSDRMD